MSIVIAGTGSYVPERCLTNAELEKMVDTTDEWIVSRTGISERRIATNEETCSTMCIEAARRALDSAGMTGKDISAILVATTTPDYVFPNTASLVQRGIEAFGCFCLDISSACTGFIAGINVGCSLLQAHEEYESVMICGSEKLSCITDWQDRNTCVLFGDGAGALILRRVRDGKDDCCINVSEVHADGTYAEILCLPAGGSRNPTTAQTVEERLHYIHMRGRETFKLAVLSMAEAAKSVLNRAGVTFDQVALLVPHQANIRIIQAVAKQLELPDEKVFTNIEKYGNTSAASIAISLDEVIRSGRIKRGDKLLLASFGSGLTWGAVLITY